MMVNEIEHIKDMIANNPELVRRMLEDLLSRGECFVRITQTAAAVLPSTSMHKTSDGYEQIYGSSSIKFKRSEILCLSREAMYLPR